MTDPLRVFYPRRSVAPSHLLRNYLNYIVKTFILPVSSPWCTLYHLFRFKTKTSSIPQGNSNIYKISHIFFPSFFACFIMCNCNMTSTKELHLCSMGNGKDGMWNWRTRSLDLGFLWRFKNVTIIIIQNISGLHDLS